MKPLNIVVLVKQVPDTHNVGPDAMKANGTVNRAALKAIFNPEDLNALEQALRVKDRVKGSKVTLLSMGPPRAAEILRDGIFRGADSAILVTDRRFAGSDTLATSYALSLAIKKLQPVDLVFAGRQAIDGDTAQVGPQVAQKIDYSQITYVEEITEVNDRQITAKRRLENGFEIVRSQLPCLLTVHSSAPPARPRIAKRLMKYKHAKTPTELKRLEESALAKYKEKPYLNIPEWTVEDINADETKLGLGGSPTKVKKVENIILKAKEAKRLTNSDEDIETMIVELLENHTIG